MTKKKNNLINKLIINDIIEISIDVIPIKSVWPQFRHKISMPPIIVTTWNLSWRVGQLVYYI